MLKSAVLALFVAAFSLLASDAKFDGYKTLLRVPDLSPNLTKEEVSTPYQQWQERIENASVGWGDEFAVAYSGARKALSLQLPKVNALTLYSLHPINAHQLDASSPKSAEALKKLPRFHDFPILGEVKLDNAEVANNYVDFLRDQIIPGGVRNCDFMPRHGFRLSTPEGDLDFLMCFSCDQLSFYGPGKLDQKHNPIFSPLTQTLLNQLFDKLKIQRDLDSKPAE